MSLTIAVEGLRALFQDGKRWDSHAIIVLTL
jgi:hypothetical protein